MHRLMLTFAVAVFAPTALLLTTAAPELAKTHRVYLMQVNGFGGDSVGENAKPGILDGIASDLDAYIRAQQRKPSTKS